MHAIPKTRQSGRATAVVVAVVGILVFAAWFAMRGGREADTLQKQIRVGMTLPEMLAVPGISSPERKWFACFIIEETDRETGVWFECRNRTLHQKDKTTVYPQESDFWQAFEKHVRGGTTDWKITYHFVSSPRRVNFSVVLGPDGKVKEVTPVRGAD